MKQRLSLLLTILLLVCLCGCQLGNGIKEPVDFYYKRTSYVYGSSDGVIASEQREASGHREDLNYLLAMYLQGPLDDKLVSPFPTGCKVVEITQEGTTVQITLNSAFSRLKNLNQTIGAACLAKTCMALTGADTVVIETEDPDNPKSLQIIITQEDLMLYDNSELIPLETE